MHVFDAAAAVAPTAALRPEPASVAQYEQLQRRLGTTRNVLVQPSTDGTDNSLLLSALAQKGSSARGIAVIDNTTQHDELDALAHKGVVGIRFNQVQAGATSLGMLYELMPRLKERNWHVQMHLPVDELLAREDMLAALPVNLVLDHFARVAEHPAKCRLAFSALRRVLDSGKCWLKLSAPYLASAYGGPNFADLTEIAEALVKSYPERLLWGSDWPHATEATKPNDADMLDWLMQLIPNTTDQHRIFVDNPAALYKFA
jgi:D-galactarolactone isomerase